MPQHSGSAGTLHELSQAIVRKRFHMVIVSTGHRMVVYKCIDDCFLCSLDYAREKRIHQIIRNCLNGVGHLIRIRDVWIRR